MRSRVGKLGEMRPPSRRAGNRGLCGADELGELALAETLLYAGSGISDASRIAHPARS